MFKGIIAPIVAVVFLAVQGIFGISVSEELQNEVIGVVSNVIAVAVTLYGVITNTKKDKVAPNSK